jgi:hypothetical protein
MISASAQGISEHFDGRWWAHGDHSDLTPVSILDTKGHFEGEEIIGVDDGWQGLTIYCPVFLQYVGSYMPGVRNLFDQANHTIRHRHLKRTFRILFEKKSEGFPKRKVSGCED